jgi:hypothetical protein
MKTFKLLFASLTLVCGQAFAAPVTFTDTVTYAPPILVNAGNSPYVFNFNINDDGFNAVTDTITNYSIAFNLYDDPSDPNNQSTFLGTLKYSQETARIGQPGFGDWIFTNLNGTETVGSSWLGLIELNAIGLLTVSISSIPVQFFPFPITGDFYLGGGTLVAEAERVPEPGSLLLLGAALSAATFAARRRKQ